MMNLAEFIAIWPPAVKDCPKAAFDAEWNRESIGDVKI